MFDSRTTPVVLQGGDIWLTLLGSEAVAKEVGVELRGELSALLPEVDFLTVHTPLLASTANLVGEKELRSMKKSARVLK